MNAKNVAQAIKEGHFLKSAVNYIGKHMLSDDNRCTSAMIYAAEDVKPKIKSNDYVRTASLELAAHEIARNKVEGNVAELGVFRGDFASLINLVFPQRTLYLFDTFEGFNERDIKKEVDKEYSTGTQDFSDTSVEIVLGKMPHRDKCVVRKGWFPQTAKGLENEQFAFVSIDADLHDPIYEGLKFFYPRLAVGGMIFVHDFNNAEYKGAAEAVREYSTENGVPYFPLCDGCGSAVVMK